MILLHAFPLSKAMWQVQLDSLSAFCRVICPDLPGFGKSWRADPPSIGMMAEAVWQFLEDLKIRKPVFLIGLSMGGYVALEFIKQYPRRVRGLGLLATRAGGDSEEQKKKRYELAGRVRKDGCGVLQQTVLPKLLGQTTKQGHPEVLAAVSRMLEPNSSEGIADALEAMARRSDSTPELAKIRCPVLIAAGAEDEIIPAAETEMMHELISNSSFQIIEGAGHLLNLERPDIVDDLLTQWIRTITG